MGVEARGSGAGREQEEQEEEEKALESREEQRWPALLCCAPAAREGALAAGELRMGLRSPEPRSAGLGGLEPSFLIEHFFCYHDLLGSDCIKGAILRVQKTRCPGEKLKCHKKEETMLLTFSI